MGRRLRNIPVGFDYLARALKGHAMFTETTDVPADTTILSVHIDPTTRQLIVTAESMDFDEVLEGAIIPRFNPTVTVTTTEMAMLADLVSNRHDYCRHCGEPLGDNP